METPLLTQRVNAWQLDPDNLYPDEPLPPAYIFEFYEQYGKEMIAYACGSEIRIGRQKCAAINAFCRQVLNIKPRYNGWEYIQEALEANGYRLFYGHKIRHLKSSRTFYVIAKFADDDDAN